MALINKQKGIGSDTSTDSIVTPLSEGELGLQQNRGEISIGTKNGNVIIEGTELAEKRMNKVNAFMSKAGFEANAARNREIFAGSGFVGWGGNYGASVNQGLNTTRTWYNWLNIGDNGSYDKGGKHTPIVNVNGVLQNISAVRNVINQNSIFFSEPNLPTIESDSSILSKDYKQGDNILLTDTYRNIGTNKITGVVYTGNNDDGWVQSNAAKLVVTSDLTAGTDLYDNISKVMVTDSFSRQDLVFLESWHEDISEKGIVYPYGNVQYSGNNTDGISGIADGTFTGADTYSLFGNWQEAGALVGKGYIWGDLTEAQQVEFVGNPENNIYKDGDKVIQVRYRIRVVKGLSNTPTAYNNAQGTLVYTLEVVQAKGKFTNITSDLVKKGYATRFIETRHAFNKTKALGVWEMFYTSQNLTYGYSGFALPIALVQRRNQGIYDPVFNNEGCAKVDDGGAKFWYESTLINSVEDCFDTALIVGGTIASGISGRPDGLYADEVNERDVEDLRMDAHKVTDYKGYLEEKFNEAVAGKLRGKESVYKLEMYTHKAADHYTANAGETFLDWKWQNLSNGHINSPELECLYINGTYIRPKDIHAIVLSDGTVISTIHKKHYDGGTGSAGIYLNRPLTSTEADLWNNTDSVILYASNKMQTLVQNNTITVCDIIGDLRKIKDRVSLEVTDTDTTVDIAKGQYLLCSDGTNNSGTAGHYYLALSDITNIHTNSTDGAANTADGHIDFSVDTVWTALGDVGTAGGYPQKWLDHGVFGTPLLTGENGEDLTPIKGYFNGHISSNLSDIGYSASPKAVYLKLPRKGSVIKAVIATAKDGRQVKYEPGGWSGPLQAEGGPGTFNIGSGNHVFINIGHADTLTALGYASVTEALSNVIFQVFYETSANNTELANNNKVLALNSDVFIGNRGNYNYQGIYLIQSLMNKTVTDITTTSAGIVNTGMVYHAGGMLNEWYNSSSSYPQLPQHQLVTVNGTGPTCKILPYLTSSSNRAQMNLVFKEMKFDNASVNQDGTPTNTWGDDNKFQIRDGVSTFTDDNSNTVLYGQKSIKLDRFID